ncbi:hypothetical protein MTR67_023299 [Solanum verrucosum]|uniref:Uncharacterized protein n=1 Tax=Solanum verrucosum TaxID=315347 RepID=A0AAF0R1L0_SOLVR|nr:hypothetical protein MTR67_023299 [Solanum verrucosum]
MDTPLENEEDGALKLTLPKESYDLDRDSQDLPEEFEKTATYGGNENESCIQIFKRKVEEKEKTKLKGHHKRLTGLAFSNSLNILISAGADYQEELTFSQFEQGPESNEQEIIQYVSSLIQVEREGIKG